MAVPFLVAGSRVEGVAVGLLLLFSLAVSLREKSDAEGQDYLAVAQLFLSGVYHLLVPGVEKMHCMIQALDRVVSLCMNCIMRVRWK